MISYHIQLVVGKNNIDGQISDPSKNGVQAKHWALLQILRIRHVPQKLRNDAPKCGKRTMERCGLTGRYWHRFMKIAFFNFMIRRWIPPNFITHMIMDHFHLNHHRWLHHHQREFKIVCRIRYAGKNLKNYKIFLTTNRTFRHQIEHFVKRRNFVQKSKMLSTIEILVKV